MKLSSKKKQQSLTTPWKKKMVSARNLRGLSLVLSCKDRNNEERVLVNKQGITYPQKN